MTTSRASVPPLQPDPEYLKAFAQIMARIEHALGPKRPAKPVIVCVAGGAAMHFYTGARFSNDIDARIFARVMLDPRDLQVAYRGEDGHARLLYFDTQYNDSFALLHANAYDDARPISVEGVDPRRLEVRLLTPLDLGVSKLARFSEQDQDDIRALARAGLIDAVALRRRAGAALPDYVGNLDRIKTLIGVACRLIATAHKT
ncbi:MAG: hypothetical protein HYU77_03390 [Betaproteobacteria bacterium]|nr:hypothetical protein [Betaproteobacteria bacterium]